MRDTVHLLKAFCNITQWRESISHEHSSLYFQATLSLPLKNYDIINGKADIGRKFLDKNVK